MNFVRKQLYLHALNRNEDMTINSVKKFLRKYKKSIIKATLLFEYIKVKRIQNISKIIDPNKELPVEIIFQIIELSGF